MRNWISGITVRRSFSFKFQKIIDLLSRVDAVIVQFGADEYPRAVKVKERLIKLQDAAVAEINNKKGNGRQS